MAPPANWTPVTVTGTYIHPDGTPASGTVTFTSTVYLRDPDLNYVVIPKPVQVTLDGSGHFSTTLMATDDPDIDPNFYYTVTESLDGISPPTTFPLLVPKDTIGSLDLADVDRNNTIPPEPEIYTRTINGLYGDVTLPDDLGRVPTSRTILPADGTLTGGGDLTANRTFAVVPDSVTERLEFYKAAAAIGTRKRVNFIDGANIVTTVADNSGQNRVDVTTAATGVMTNTAGVVSFSAGSLSSRPAAGASGRFWYATDLNTMFEDTGTGWVQLDQNPAISNSWTAVGHSYLQSNGNAYNQRSRLDSIVRSRFDAESTNWANLAVAGSCVTIEGANRGGWAAFVRQITKLPGKTSPYTSSDGAMLVCTGINDLGTLGGATAQMQTAFGHAMRFLFSRWRASTVWEETGAPIAFSGTWTTESGFEDRASGGSWRYCNTGSGTVTLTLPSDYNGEVIALMSPGRPGSNGGTATISGTAMAGKTLNGATINIDNIMPALSFSNVPVITRIKDLTSANAGQTIVLTRATGAFYFDSAWIEAAEAPPIVACNIARLTASGYSTKYPSWTAQTGTLDSDVAAFNTVLTNVKNEFDGMIQIADIDSVLNKTASLFTDGLHPNERGAALIADEIDNARRKMSLTGSKSPALNMNMGPRYSGGVRLRRRSGFYHTAPYTAITTYTPVVGDMFALPYEVTEMDELYARWAMVVAAATSGTCTIRWGLAVDYMNKGYPDVNLQELTVAGAYSVSTTLGPQLNPAAQFSWYPDIAQYFLMMKIETIGTGFTFAALQGPSMAMPPTTSGGDIRTATAGTNGVAWKWTGQATGAFPNFFPAGATPANIAPYMGALKS